MLGTQNCSQIDELFTKGGQENLDVFYLTRRFFGLPRQSIRSNSDRIIFLKQTLRDVESMYYDINIGAYDIKYDEFKELCGKPWSEK